MNSYLTPKSRTKTIEILKVNMKEVQELSKFEKNVLRDFIYECPSAVFTVYRDGTGRPLVPGRTFADIIACPHAIIQLAADAELGDIP